MCGRTACALNPKYYEKSFKIKRWKDRDKFKPRYNVCPGTFCPVIVKYDEDNVNGGKQESTEEQSISREVVTMKWGLIPSFCKDLSRCPQPINARCETLESKPTFRKLISTRRCVVMADGYYEWHQKGSSKQPYYIKLSDGAPLAMAALYDTWESPEGDIASYAVVTCEPSTDIGFIHDRMPVLLTSDDAINTWLNCDINCSHALKLLRPTQEKLDFYAVSNLVNNTKNNSSDLIIPLEKRTAALTKPISSFFGKKRQKPDPKPIKVEQDYDTPEKPIQQPLKKPKIEVKKE